MRKFPTPTKQGVSEDGWHSFIWKRPGGALRFRLREGEFELNEYEPRRGGVESTRLVLGSFDFCCVMASRWFEGAPASGPGGKSGTPAAASGGVPGATASPGAPRALAGA